MNLPRLAGQGGKVDKTFAEKQKKNLLEQKEKLEKELLSVANRRKKGKRYIPKFLDLGQKEDDSAQEVTNYEESLALEKNLEKMLKGTNKTLAKIKKGRFGLCEGCKKPIEQKRLEAMPAAELCVACANKPKKRFSLMFWRRRR